MNRLFNFMHNRIKNSLLFAVLLCACLLTACQSDSLIQDITTTEVASYEEVRPSGETIVCQFDESIQTAFFQFSVGKPIYENYLTIGDELFEIHDGYAFAICDVSISNTGEQAVTMFLDDFRITWKENVSDYGYGYSTMHDDAYMEDEFIIEPGETIEKKIMFKVPKDPEVTLYYEECYADDFIGNRYTITLQP